MSDLASILADVRSLANRGAHHAIVARYGTLDDTPEEETWNSTETRFEIGRAVGMRGHAREVGAAAEALAACCALDRGSAPPAIRPEHVLANRGELNLRRNDLAAAADAFRAARALDPASSYLCERLGRVQELAGDTTAAEAAYREAAALPRGSFAYLALGRFHARVTGDLPAAVAALVEALRQVPAAEPLVRVELARVELAVGRRAAALRHVERALACRREGGFAEGLRLAAELCEQLGRAADARRYLEQLARLAPADAEIAARAAALAAAAD